MSDEVPEIIEMPLLRIIGNQPTRWSQLERRAVFYRLVAWLTAGNDQSARKRALSKFHLDMTCKLEKAVARGSIKKAAQLRLKHLLEYERELYRADEESLLAAGGIENYKQKLKPRKTGKEGRLAKELRRVLTVGEVALIIARSQLGSDATGISIDQCRKVIKLEGKAELNRQKAEFRNNLDCCGCVAQLCGAISMFLRGETDKFLMKPHSDWRQYLPKILYDAHMIEKGLFQFHIPKQKFSSRYDLILLPEFNFSGLKEPSLKSLTSDERVGLSNAKKSFTE